MSRIIEPTMHEGKCVTNELNDILATEGDAAEAGEIGRARDDQDCTSDQSRARSGQDSPCPLP